jgi:phospholipid N-methyltransferase
MQLGSAEDLLEVLANWRLGAPDVIISGIPFSTMTANAAERIAHAIGESLAPGGRFIAYQVRAHVVDYIRPHLGDPETQWELLNIPPVRVFRWVKNG